MIRHNVVLVDLPNEKIHGATTPSGAVIINVENVLKPRCDFFRKLI